MEYETAQMTGDNEIVLDYTRIRSSYELFAVKLKDLLCSLLEERGVKYHLVEARAKSVASFAEKVARPNKRYADPLKEVPDLCGCRIILYYTDAIIDASKIILDEFDVLEEETAHQADSLGDDRFGYLSLHYVVRMKDNRAALGEWNAFRNLHAEIQLRTIIQHAWSAVSHALQYKQESQVPSLLRRRLFRIAGLFELADEEFVSIRNQQVRVAKDVVESLSTGHNAIPLSIPSVLEYVEHWPKKSAAVADALDAGFDMNDDESVAKDLSFIPQVIRICEKNDIHTIKDLEQANITSDREFLMKLMKLNRATESSSWQIGDGFLFLLLLIRRFYETVSEADVRDWSTEVRKILFNALPKEA